MIRIKLDENLGSLRVVTKLRLAGHDVATVREQSLTSTPDIELASICGEEERCLVTLDRGFGNRLRFNPSDYAGIIVIRLSSQATFAELLQAIETLILGLEQAEVVGRLWIVQPGRILQYQSIKSEGAEE
nr:MULTISPECIES: DUF5615 family PIN-like protein [Desertifilum]